MTIRLNSLIEIEKRLRQLEKLRNREPEKRWQAAYDLMLAQVVAYQIKAYEYRANLWEMAKNPPKPSQFPNPELFVDWTLDHSHERKAPKENTEKPTSRPPGCSTSSSSATPTPPGPTSPSTRSAEGSASSATSGTTSTAPATTNGPSSCPSSDGRLPMDGPTLGLVGGITGGVIGGLGGLLGTYRGIKGTNGPRERAHAIRAAVLCWLGISAFLACVFVLPFPWQTLVWLVYAPCLIFFIKRWNEGQALAKAEDQGEGGLPGGQV